MNDDRCAISVEGDEGYVRCSNQATRHGLCEEHRAEIARADNEHPCDVLLSTSPGAGLELAASLAKGGFTALAIQVTEAALWLLKNPGAWKTETSGQPADIAGILERAGSQVAKVAKTQSIYVTGPGKPGHQIDGAGEKVLGQGPEVGE